MTIRFDDRVALVTGAGNGLGRAHALSLAERGATVIVNDLGGARDGSGASSDAAKAVVAEIEAMGGKAMADGTNVTDPDGVQAMVKAIVGEYGHLDIVVNNAGILRDKSFSKMSVEDFDSVIAVHLRGSFLVTHAAWPIMREQNYGRIVFTTSSSGLYGNFGQSNYGAAKMAVVGLMNTLVIEGAKNDIRVNCLAPTALTRMTEDLGIPEAAAEKLTPESVAPALLYLVSENAPTRMILGAGAGGYAVSKILQTEGVYLPVTERTPEALAAAAATLQDETGYSVPKMGAEQTTGFLTKAMADKSA